MSIAAPSGPQAIGRSQGLPDPSGKGRIWFAMRTKSAEQTLIAAAKSPATAAEAHYWLGRIYDFKGNKAEGAFPGFHEEVAYRPRAEAEFTAAGTPKPEWIAEAEAVENALKAADAAIAKLQAGRARPRAELRAAIEARIKLRPDPMAYIAGANLLLARNARFAVRRCASLPTDAIAGERFIRENESSYKLDGKVQASLDRNAAAFADIAGWALYPAGRSADGAETVLPKRRGCYRNVDATNQLHLAELSVQEERSRDGARALPDRARPGRHHAAAARSGEDGARRRAGEDRARIPRNSRSGWPRRSIANARSAARRSSATCRAGSCRRWC